MMAYSYKIRYLRYMMLINLNNNNIFRAYCIKIMGVGLNLFDPPSTHGSISWPPLPHN